MGLEGVHLQSVQRQVLPPSREVTFKLKSHSRERPGINGHPEKYATRHTAIDLDAAFKPFALLVAPLNGDRFPTKRLKQPLGRAKDMIRYLEGNRHSPN